MRKVTGRRGSIFAGVLILLFASLACSLMTLSCANKVFDTLGWQTMLLKLDNTAVQAKVIAEAWFFRQAENDAVLSAYEFEPDALPKDDPYIEIPSDLLNELKALNKNIDIKAEIIDENYSDAFKADAERMGIPFGSPSEYMIQREGESADVLCIKSYCLRVSVSLHERSEEAVVLAENILAVKDTGNSIRLIPLYTKKEH